jgi:toxin-antitoxin system PIN domain toxin
VVPGRSPFRSSVPTLAGSLGVSGFRHRNYCAGPIFSKGRYRPSSMCFIRVVTNPTVFNHPSSLVSALRFTDELRNQPNCTLVAPDRRHWDIFTRLCRTVAAKGNLVPDAYFAALAIGSGSEWITTDTDYSRFPGLRWRHPLE